MVALTVSNIKNPWTQTTNLKKLNWWDKPPIPLQFNEVGDTLEIRLSWFPNRNSMTSTIGLPEQVYLGSYPIESYLIWRSASPIAEQNLDRFLYADTTYSWIGHLAQVFAAAQAHRNVPRAHIFLANHSTLINLSQTSRRHRPKACTNASHKYLGTFSADIHMRSHDAEASNR